MSTSKESRRLAWVLVTAMAWASAATEEFRSGLEAAVHRNAGSGGGILAVGTPEGVLWEGAAGSLAGPGSALIQPDTPFEIASITKALTATVILQLVEEGRLDLEAPLSTLFPPAQTGDFDGRITLQQLLNHTSGLPDYWSDGPFGKDGQNAFIRAFLADPHRIWSGEEVVTLAHGLTPARKGRFHYADTNYVLLALLIERIEGKPLHTVFRQRILDPLGMNSTWMTYREARRGPPPSHRFERRDDLANRNHQSADWGGGGLVSTTDDLARFLRGLASGRLFRRAATLETMLDAIPTGTRGVGYGLGLYTIRLDGAEGVLWGHDGHGNAFAYYWPEQDLTFTGTLNQTENRWWPLLERTLDSLRPPERAVRGQTPPAP